MQVKLRYLETQVLEFAVVDLAK